MQNFTLRFKGKMFYLLILTLLFGSLPAMYAQDCPTVDESIQTFCDGLATIDDLDANGTNIQWYDEVDSEDPLPSNEILQDSEDYFADSPDCDDPTFVRPSVTVTIEDDSQDRPELQNGEDEFFTPCERTAGSPDTRTIGDLRDGIELQAPPAGFTTEYFEREFDKNAPPLPDSFELVSGTSYFAGYYDADGDADEDVCQTPRLALRYEPIVVTAPAAESPQTVCEGTTVSELEAEGTNRFYRTMTSEPPLPDDFVVQDGRTYFATQIIPSDGPPCESTERTPITVNVIPADAGPDNTDNVLCVSDADSQLNNTTNARSFFLSLLENNNDSDPDNDVPTDGTFSDDSLAAIVADYNDGTKTGTFQTTYTADFGSGCEDSVILAVRVEEDPNAGEDTDVTVCESDIAPFIPLVAANLDAAEALFREFIEGEDIDPTGTFNPGLPEFFNQVTAAINSNSLPQTFEITYTVDNNGCEASSTIELTVLPDPDAGEDDSVTLCETDVEDRGIFDSEANLRAFYLDLLGAEDADGTFNPSLTTLIANYDDGVSSPSEDFTTEYTVDNGTCSASATANLTINAAEPANAGTVANQNFCETDATVTLSSLLSADASAGGNFSSDNADVADGTFNPGAEGPGTFTITYTVSEDDPETCVTGNAETSFTITVNEAVDAGEDDSVTLCETDVEDRGIFDSEANLRAFYLDLLGAEDADGTFNPSLTTLIANYDDGVSSPSEDFNTTYTVDNGTCTASATAELTITKAIPAEAGDIDDQVFCTNDGTINLFTLLDDTANPNGVFSSDDDDADVADGNFDPAAEGVGTFSITYTVSPETACVTDTAMVTFEIEVNQAPNAGPGGTFTFCQAEFEAIVALVIANPSAQGQALLDEFGPDITTGGTFSDDDLSTLLAQFNATTTFPASFTTTYTVSNENCTDSASYTITINPNEEADAGGNQTLAFCTTNGVQDLNDFLGDGATEGGEFTSDDLTLTDGTFDPAVAGAGTFEVTYTVNMDNTDDPCVEGENSATLTINITQAVELGEDTSDIVCENDVADDFFTEDVLTAAFLDLLQDDAPTNGTFNPSISDLIDQFEGGMTTGDFATQYTIGTDECQDSVQLTITIRENIEADLTEVDDVTVCQNAGVQDLTDFIGDNPDFGSFTVDGEDNDGTFNPGTQEPGDFEITYTLDEDETECVTGSDTITFTLTVQDSAFAGMDVNTSVCETDAVVDLTTLLTANADADGTFTVDGDEIVDGMFNPSDFDAGMVEITYTVAAENDCGDDTATITVTIEEAPDAGEDMDLTVCQNAEDQNLFDLLDDDTDNSGTFTVNGDTLENGILNPSDFEPSTFDVTYTLSNDSCGDDTATITVTVQDAANAGEDVDDISFCMSDDVQNLFDFVSAEADTDGTFTLDGDEIVDGMFDPANFDAGSVEITYTVAAINDCGDDTATLTISILEAPDAGEDINVTICQNAEDQNLFDLLDDDTDNDGIFTINGDTLENGILNPSDFEPSTFDVIFTLSNDSCDDTATITVTIQDAANAGEDMDNLSFCMSDDVQNLFDFVSAEADTNGTFTLDGETVVDGMFDPSTFEAGSIEIIYTVAAINDCGDDTSTFTIAILEAPDAPAVTDGTFCAVDMATVADLVADPTGLTFYSDEALTMMVALEDVLVDGTYYVTQTSTDSGCESQAAVVTVTINDAPTPTIDNTSQTFCRFDDATIADLEDAINESGDITFYDTVDGDNALGQGTALQDGVTYFATLFDAATGCESSVRLAITVTIENCPLLFPEGISPNGDGLNDTFDIENIEREFPNYTITIHNRWGDVVYKGNANTPDWDGFSTEGSLGDDVLPVGAYFYIIDFNDGTTPPRRGNVYLSR